MDTPSSTTPRGTCAVGLPEREHALMVQHGRLVERQKRPVLAPRGTCAVGNPEREHALLQHRRLVERQK